MPRRNRSAFRSFSVAAIATSLTLGAALGAHAVDTRGPNDPSGTSTTKEDSRNRIDTNKKKEAERAVSAEAKTIQSEFDASVREAKLAFDVARRAAEAEFKASTAVAEAALNEILNAEVTTPEAPAEAKIAFDAAVEKATAVKKSAMKVAEAARAKAFKDAESKRKAAIAALQAKPVKPTPVVDVKAETKRIQDTYTAALASARAGFESARLASYDLYDAEYATAKQAWDEIVNDANATQETLDAARATFDEALESAEKSHNTRISSAEAAKKSAYKSAEAKRKASLDALKKTDSKKPPVKKPSTNK